MTSVELADGTIVRSSCPAQTVYNAALRGIEARTLDGKHFATADLPLLHHDGVPVPYWLRLRF